MEAASEADRRINRGALRGPLDGMAVAVKDNLAVAGTSCTAGLEGRADVIAAKDAGVVSRLRAAGAVLLGGLNMHEAALGGTTDNAHFGACLNPLAPGYTPGGSSGGSGAAVAAGLVEMALGSDTMGSVRLPAAYCGVIGLKPTPGLIGRSGFVYLSPSLDTIGPLVRDAHLIWPVLNVLAGEDAGDPGSLPAPLGWADRPDRVDFAGLRFGMPRQLADVDCEPAVLQGLDRARVAIGDLGGSVVDVDLADWEPHQARRAGLLVIEAEGAVELADLMTTPGAMTDGLAAMLAYGRDLPARKLVNAWSTARAAGNAALRALGTVDGVLMPTAPQRAFPHTAEPPANQADLTALANFAGCPAVAMPVAGQGLPASVQVVSRPRSEAELIRWTEILAPALNPPSGGAATGVV